MSLSMRNMPKIAVNRTQAISIIDAAEQNAQFPIEIKKFEPRRSDRVNRTTHMWYLEMSEQDSQYDALGWKNYCKLTYGVDILMADTEFAEFHAAALAPFDYESQMKRIQFIDVTSIMNRSQAKSYMDGIYRNETRFQLTDPKPGKRKDEWANKIKEM